MCTFRHKHFRVYKRDVSHVHKRAAGRVYKRGPGPRQAGCRHSLDWSYSGLLFDTRTYHCTENDEPEIEEQTVSGIASSCYIPKARSLPCNGIVAHKTRLTYGLAATLSCPKLQSRPVPRARGWRCGVWAQGGVAASHPSIEGCKRQASIVRCWLVLIRWVVVVRQRVQLLARLLAALLQCPLYCPTR